MDNTTTLSRVDATQDLDILEALERVITANYLDINRPKLAGDTDTIMLTAQAWLRHVRHFPNSYMEHHGQTVHLIDYLYLRHMAATPSVHPLTVADLITAYGTLCKEWAAQAAREKWQEEVDKSQLYEVRPLKLKPLPPEEIKRRERLCRGTRMSRGLPALGSGYVTQGRALPGPATDGAGTANMGIGGELRKVQRARPGASQAGAKVQEAQLKGSTTTTAPLESVEQAAVRLGRDVVNRFCVEPADVARFTAFNRTWQERHGRVVEAADLEAHFVASKPTS